MWKVVSMFQPGRFHNQITRGGNRASLRDFGRGNTLLEYGLIGVLIVLVCITAIQFLGSSLDSAMAAIKHDMQTKNEAAMSAWVASKVAQGQGGTLSASDQAILESSLASKLQTTGANGSTEILAKQLEDAAKQLLKDGKIDQTQYDVLMKLANQGHKMAQIQGMISDAMNYANGDVNLFNSMSFQFEGKTYSAQELAVMVGFNGPSPEALSGSDLLAMPTGGTTGAAVGGFLSLYQEALSSGALNDPLAKATVDSASTQIASLGELTEDVIWNVQNGMPMDDANITTLTSITTTQMESSKICQAGDFVDNGALCSP